MNEMIASFPIMTPPIEMISTKPSVELIPTEKINYFLREEDIEDYYMLSDSDFIISLQEAEKGETLPMEAVKW